MNRYAEVLKYLTEYEKAQEELIVVSGGYEYHISHGLILADYIC